MNMQTFLMYLLITVLMAPLLLVYGLPFIVGARLFSRLARAHLGARVRYAVACGIAALGIAPSYDAYRAPLPIYAHRLEGADVSTGFMLASFAVTWIVVMIAARLCTRRRQVTQGA
ncbi:hypothetical protein WS62_06280 [Burkholderia sp. ABCPW 14]|uniref:Uncharacterized protein n=1 Tax=Burkholderia mayonis TaxID=1385591 RepID=A0A1B4FU95_9BURK|nr:MULTISPECIES: hypothetical protein [Burkholderia]AOJ07253.1 hypothetical protein WS71_07970 [Burkholderia mayonis]KVD74083.1 hypothetical protein WS62_06280 [Burkholderia sp. ABCPW 14]KVE47689.1 hypothetical protein WS71_19210 [Burkholderia mayonis]